MRKKKMLDAMSMLDDELIAEAAPKGRSRIRRTWITVAAAAACFAIVFGSFGIYRLLNRSTANIEQYRDNEYYPLIQKLEAFRQEREREASDMSLLARVFSFGAKEDAMAIPESSSNALDGDMLTNATSAETQRYEETTDNQVAGVIEGDLIKRSDRYLYYLHKDAATLYVYSIEGEASKKVGSFSFSLTVEETRLLSFRGFSWEMYLSEDCRTLLVIAPYYIKNDERGGRQETAVIALDVTDPEAIVEKNRIVVAGEYHSSRMTDGKLYLLNQFWIEVLGDYERLESFVPQIDRGNGFESLPMSQIVMPEEITSAGYTVISRIDAQSLSVEEGLGCLSYVDDLYASRDALYLARSSTEEEKDGGNVTRRSHTEIFRVSYADGRLTPCQTVRVEGTVKDQYSFDEYEGILRVVTSTSVDQYEKTRKYSTFISSEDNASLYAIDVATMQVVSSVERFAPIGETVRSVRFDGTKGYVCTAIRQTDPVFFFDLTDIHNITYTDTGTIPGFSTSLIQYGNGLLLGIGEENGTPKVEIYAQDGNKVISLDRYEVIGSYGYGTAYKSYLVDREAGLFGFGVYQKNRFEYLVFSLKDGNLSLCEKFAFDALDASLADIRAVNIDGCLYVLADRELATKSLDGLTNPSP